MLNQQLTNLGIKEITFPPNWSPPMFPMLLYKAFILLEIKQWQEVHHLREEKDDNISLVLN